MGRASREKRDRMGEPTEPEGEAPPAETPTPANNVNVQAGVATACAGPTPVPAEEG